MKDFFEESHKPGLPTFHMNEMNLLSDDGKNKIIFEYYGNV